LAQRTPDPGMESEWLTRRRRIDPLLDAAGWPVPKGRSNAAFRTEEEETAHGPADYALWLDDRVVGIVEAKKLTGGPQNVLTRPSATSAG
jgi:type I restriction enzyme, R subunit